MHYSTKKWIFTKISSLILIPFMIWFLISFVSIYDKDYFEIIEFFSSKASKVLFSLLVIIAFFFYSLTISEIFEDYLHEQIGEKELAIKKLKQLQKQPVVEVLRCTAI